MSNPLTKPRFTEEQANRLVPRLAIGMLIVMIGAPVCLIIWLCGGFDSSTPAKHDVQPHLRCSQIGHYDATYCDNGLDVMNPSYKQTVVPAANAPTDVPPAVAGN